MDTAGRLEHYRRGDLRFDVIDRTAFQGPGHERTNT